MKKVIERMNTTVVSQQGLSSPSKESSGKRKWLSRKLTGGGGGDKSSSSTSPNPDEEPENEGLRVDFYLVVFLKFIASIVPTIEVDSTTAF